jgi:hypothetical protein
MSDRVNRMMAALTGMYVTNAEGEFVGMTPDHHMVARWKAEGQLGSLVAQIETAHEEVERALVTAVVKGIEAGKALIVLKNELPHGFFEDFVESTFFFSVRTAQSYMRLARQEGKLRQLVDQKAQLGSHLTMKDAFKFLGSLSTNKKRKSRR